MIKKEELLELIKEKTKSMGRLKIKRKKAQTRKKLYKFVDEEKYEAARVEYTNNNKSLKKERETLAEELDKILKEDMKEINSVFPKCYEWCLNRLRVREALNQQVNNIKKYSETEYPVAKKTYDTLMKHRYEVYDLYQEYKERAKKARKEGGKKESGYDNFFADNMKTNTFLEIFKENVHIVNKKNIIKIIETVNEEKDKVERQNKLVKPISPADTLEGYTPNTVLMSYCKKTDYELLSEIGEELLKELGYEIAVAIENQDTESLEIFLRFAVSRRCDSQTSFKGEKREKKKKEKEEKKEPDEEISLTVNISGKSVSTLQKEYRELLKKYAKKCDE